MSAGTPPAPAELVLVRASDAEVLTHGPGSLVTLLTDSDATGGALTSNRATLRRGVDGAPPHFHTKAAEMLFVLDGSLRVLAGDRVLTLYEGDTFLAPPRLTHAFAPAPDADAEVLVVFTPGMDRFDYYRLLDRVNSGEADPAEIARSQQRFDNHYVDSPVWREALKGRPVR
ncbi:cupin domain-containing protein [Streptomyces sp. WMMC500]|uniref:cupin domain-containing protein n=1 Tax=Streptomyces sp. WMMC500 TaxID=3015154 RepID=UPI00248B3BC0|nr:cupin domain-containing protein [Streptomyces sp. WMMC500]WBB59658.1 cupin domain-containing protein [Streptomyces sp. WMMC500]